MIRAHGGFAFQDSLLDGEIVDLADAVFNGGRSGVLSQRQPGTSGVEHAHSFVGQLASRKIAVGKMDGSGQSLIQNADFMVLLERRNDAAQHGHALRLDGLFYLYHLETAGQCRIFFKIFLVFRPGCGGDRAQFAAR